MSEALRVSLEACTERSEVEPLWRELEARAQARIFTSWLWIGTWLELLPADLKPQLLIARQGKRPVGLAFIVPSHNHIFRFIPTRCWRLHKTGVAALDELTIEYNGMLVERENSAAISRAMISFVLANTERPCIDVKLGDANMEAIAKQAQPGFLAHSIAKPSYVVDLDKVRSTGLAALSANTRARLRRSLASYGKLGPVEVAQADSLALARQYFEALLSLHARSWARRGLDSAFSSNASVIDFHRRFIDAAFDADAVQLLRVTAADAVIGYLYHLVYRGRIIYYQAGFDYELLPRSNLPGMVCHWLAIEHGARQGLLQYDFLAGHNQCKASLATHLEPQAWCVFRRDTPINRMDAWLRERWRDGRVSEGRKAQASPSATGAALRP